MKKISFRIGENEKKVLKYIGLGLLIYVGLGSPKMPQALLSIIKKRGQKGLRKLLKNLEKKRYINLGGEKIKLTKKGKTLLQEIAVSEIKFSKPDKWDGLWRLVSYDIPEVSKKFRDLFRNILERNGFCKIQESLWVFPYECKEEIAILAKQLNLSPYVVVMTTDHLPNQKEMVDHFGLK